MAFQYEDKWNYKKTAENEYSALMNLYNNGPNTKYQTDVDSLYDQIMNYGDFSYDMEKDRLFQLYKNKYVREGKLAAKDQMGVAAANSNGYGSSYAQTASNQAYQNSMNALSEKAVDTYQNAYNNFQNDFSNLMNRYSMAADMNSAEQNKYYSQLNAQNAYYQNSYNTYRDDYNMQYSQFTDNRNYNATERANKQAQSNWEREYQLKNKYGEY